MNFGAREKQRHTRIHSVSLAPRPNYPSNVVSYRMHKVPGSNKIGEKDDVGHIEQRRFWSRLSHFQSLMQTLEICISWRCTELANSSWPTLRVLSSSEHKSLTRVFNFNNALRCLASTNSNNPKRHAGMFIGLKCANVCARRLQCSIFND